jgi:non-specific protein-tyrosine kinase
MAEPLAQVQTLPRLSLKPKADGIFRGLWASVFYSGRVSGKTVVFCSSDRREGASTMVAGLAVAGQSVSGAAKVALVDFNLRQPVLHEIFGLRPGPGVVEAVLQNLAPAAVAQPVSPGLDVLVAGSEGGRILDILRSGALGSFVKALEASYEYVLIDAPSANHYPDALVLGGLVKDVVLTAHTEQTPREAVAQARKRLESAGGRVVGVILNLRSYPIPKFLYRRV